MKIINLNIPGFLYCSILLVTILYNILYYITVYTIEIKK